MNEAINTSMVINILLGIVLAGLCWWMKNVWAMVIKQQEQITSLNIELAKNYVPRVELQQTFTKIFESLEEIQKAVARVAAH